MAGENKSLIVGAFHNITVGKNYLINVMGSLLEIVKGNRESETNERKEIAKVVDVFSSEGSINMKSAKEINKHAAEKSKIS
jgi:coenzyme F420-reducing hydrogenase gamma subunit